MPTDLITILIGLLTPFIVKFLTDALKSWFASITGLTTILIVTILSGLVTLVSQLTLEGSPHWYFQFALALLAVVVDQIKKLWDETHPK